MKVLLTFFTLLFSFSNLNAKEQFLKIENIKIWDSVLNYFTYEELEEYNLSYDTRLEEYGFIGLEVSGYLKNYDGLQVFYGREDLLIYYVAAIKLEDVKRCKNKQGQYVENIMENYLVPELTIDSRTNPEEMPFYLNSNSYIYGVRFSYDNGIDIQFSCYDYGENLQMPDQIRNEIFSPEFKAIYE